MGKELAEDFCRARWESEYQESRFMMLCGFVVWQCFLVTFTLWHARFSFAVARQQHYIVYSAAAAAILLMPASSQRYHSVCCWLNMAASSGQICLCRRSTTPLCATGLLYEVCALTKSCLAFYSILPFLGLSSQSVAGSALGWSLRYHSVGLCHWLSSPASSQLFSPNCDVLPG